MSSEDFKSLIVTDPDLVDEGIDVSGLRTTTDTSPFLLGNIPDSPGIQYSTLAPTKYTDLMRLYSEGLPTLDIPQAAAPVTTAPDTGDGGQATTIQPIDTGGNTDFEQNLIDEGIGVQLEPGAPVVAPGEIPVTQQEMDDFNAIPVSQPVTGGITGDPIEIGIPDNESGYIDPLITQAGAPVVFDINQTGDPALNPGSTMVQGDDPYKNLPQEQQDPGFWETARNNFLQTGQDVGNFFKDLGSQGLDIGKLAGTTLLNLAGKAITGIPLLGTALSLLGGAESASGAQQGLVSDQFEEEGVTLDDIGRIQQVGLDYDTPENVMAGYSPGETGVRIGDITVGGGTIQESIVDRLADLENTKNQKYDGSFYDANGNPKLNPDTGQPTTLGAREEALKENLNTVARAAGAVTLDGPQYTQQPTLERAQELFPDDKERQNLFMELNKGYAPFSDTKTAGITLGPGEAGFLDDLSDLVTKEEQDAINLQEAVDAGIQAADDNSGSEMLDTSTPFDADRFDDDVTLTGTPPIGTITPLEDDFESLVDTIPTGELTEEQYNQALAGIDTNLTKDEVFYDERLGYVDADGNPIADPNAIGNIEGAGLENLSTLDKVEFNKLDIKDKLNQSGVGPPLTTEEQQKLKELREKREFKIKPISLNTIDTSGDGSKDTGPITTDITSDQIDEFDTTPTSTFDAEEEDEIYEPPTPSSPPTGTDRPGGDSRDDSPAPSPSPTTSQGVTTSQFQAFRDTGGGGGQDSSSTPSPSAPSSSSPSTGRGRTDAQSQYGGSSYSGGGGGGGGGCFLAGTLITMADGSTKEVQKVDLGDNVAEGGKVFATGKFLVENLHDYKGIKVSGSHMVNENNNWVRVEDSKHGKSLGDNEHTVYVFGSENRRILINDILFTDYFETTEQEKLINDEKDFFNNWKTYENKIDQDNINILNAS